MAIQIQGNGATVAEVGGTTFRGLNVHVKPLEYGALGHYSTSVRISSTAAQAANSGIFEIRNTHATNLIIPTRLTVTAIQATAGTLQENSLDLYRCTAFTVSSTTNTVTPVSSVKRASMAAYPGGAAIRHLTLAGAAAGMTGGTRTKDTQFAATLPYMVTAGVATAHPFGDLALNGGRRAKRRCVTPYCNSLVLLSMSTESKRRTLTKLSMPLVFE